MNGWIGFDLDGTLAFYDEWRGPSHIGAPIQPMVDIAKKYIGDGYEVRIFTARVSRDNPARMESLDAIMVWSKAVFGRSLPITAEKDYGMIDLYDDRCHQVETNTGRIIAAALAEKEAEIARPDCIKCEWFSEMAEFSECDDCMWNPAFCNRYKPASLPPDEKKGEPLDL